MDAVTLIGNESMMNQLDLDAVFARFGNRYRIREDDMLQFTEWSD